MTSSLVLGQTREIVTVHLENEANASCETVVRAKATTTEIFKRIGIPVVWSRAAASGQSPILIHLRDRTPAAFHHGALAFAEVFEGTRITVFFDRIEAGRHAGRILAHVFAHEIAHLLQGIDRHSSSGIMKSRWDHNDFGNMRYEPLSFEQLDIDLMHEGYARRAGSAILAATR